MHKTVVPALLGAVFSLGLSASAHAQNARTWISGSGTDVVGCGPIASPCRSLQFAHDQTNAGGEIDVKDSAGYGSLTISKGISIVGDGRIAGVLAPAGGTGITVNAGTSDTVVLRGLTIEGSNVANNGVVINSARKLDIANCVIQGFIGDASLSTGFGVRVTPTSGNLLVSIVDTNISHNGYVGFGYSASGNAVASIILDRIKAIDNVRVGVLIEENTTTGTVTFAISNSLAAANGYAGFLFAGSNTGGSIGSSISSRNSLYGIFNHDAQVSSFKNNELAPNPIPVSGTLGTATLY